MKFKINSDDDLPLNRQIFLYDVVILTTLPITHKYFGKRILEWKKKRFIWKKWKVEILKRTSIDFLNESEILRNTMLDLILNNDFDPGSYCKHKIRNYELITNFINDILW